MLALSFMYHRVYMQRSSHEMMQSHHRLPSDGPNEPAGTLCEISTDGKPSHCINPLRMSNVEMYEALTGCRVVRTAYN